MHFMVLISSTKHSCRWRHPSSIWELHLLRLRCIRSNSADIYISIRVSRDVKDVGFQKRNVLSSNIVSTPPWLLMRPVVNYSLHSADKPDIPAEIHKHRFYELCDLYVVYYSIYTDGSKVGDRVASAIIIQRHHQKAYECQIWPASFELLAIAQF